MKWNWIPLLLLFFPPTVPAQELRPSVRHGFTIERVTTPKETLFPMFAVFDTKGRLYVAESSGLDLYAELQAQTRRCRIRRLEDRDGNGSFETSILYADHLVFPMGLAWRKGRLYVADPPDLVVYQDLNEDGRADTRETLLTGFGHLDNGSLHGLTFGPDGWLYMTMGEPDGYQLPQKDGSLLEGKTGALLRCQPDGSNPEVLSRGFVNLVEIAFTRTGEIIGTDNWFTLPVAGTRDALVHLLPGGLYPLHKRDVGTPLLFSGEILPALELYPAVAVSGLLAYEGGNFPAPAGNSFFSAQHNSRKVVQHVLTRNGPSFRVENSDLVFSDDPDFHPSDVLQDSDGSLLVIDTGGWYVQHCPTGKIRDSRAPGGIYRVRYSAAQILSDPWGKGISWTTLPVQTLISYLADPRWAVREKTMEQLDQRPIFPSRELKQIYHQTRSVDLKLKILQLAQAPEDLALAALQSQNEELIIAGLRTRTQSPSPKILKVALRLLNHPSPSVQLAATETLGSFSNSLPGEKIWQILAQAQATHLRHALVRTIAQSESDQRLIEKSRSGSDREKAIAWVLLQQRQKLTASPHDLPFVWSRLAEPDRDKLLYLFEKHPDWGNTAVEVVRRQGNQGHFSPLLGELIALFIHQPSLQAGLVPLFENSPVSFRKALFNHLQEIPMEHMPASWKIPFQHLLKNADSDHKEKILDLVTRHRWHSFDSELNSLAGNVSAPVILRLKAIEAQAYRGRTLSELEMELFKPTMMERPSQVLMLAKGFKTTGSQFHYFLAFAKDQPSLRPVEFFQNAPTLTASEQESIFSLLVFFAKEGRLSLADWNQIRPQFPSLTAPRLDELKSVLPSTNDPKKRLEEWAEVLTRGNPDQGKKLFFSKAACFSCHSIGDSGPKIGPDLTRIGAIRSGRDLLESILFPSSTFAQGYETHQVQYGEEMISGILVHETSEVIRIQDSAGANHDFFRGRIQSHRQSPISLMPEGIEQALTRDEMADVIAYLRSLR